MTDHSAPAVVPPVPLVGRGDLHRQDPSARPVLRPPLPLTRWAQQRAGDAVYGLSTLDAGGRVADRAVMTALGWACGHRLGIRVSGGLIVVCADTHGIFRVSTQRFLHLPVAARRWCQLAAGDRVLLAAYPQGGLLMVHPPALLDAVIAQIHAEALKDGHDE